MFRKHNIPKTTQERNLLRRESRISSKERPLNDVERSLREGNVSARKRRRQKWQKI